MIQAKDLRLGNWLKNAKTGEPFEILHADIKVCEKYNDGFNLWTSPIELTEDVLLKCGFKNVGGNFEKEWLCLHAHLKNGTFDFLIHEPNSNKIKTKALKYMHQLQNLIHAISGEELIYKP